MAVNPPQEAEAALQALEADPKAAIRIHPLGFQVYFDKVR
jgi:hypothetical protein